MPGSGIVLRPALHWLSRRVGDWRRSSSRLLLPTKPSSVRCTVNLTSSNAQPYLTMQTQLGHAPVSSFGYPRNTRFKLYALPSSANPLFLSHICCAHRRWWRRAYKHMGHGDTRPTDGGTLTLLLWLLCDLRPLNI